MAKIIKSSSKSTKSDSVTIRLDPKLKFTAELAARSQRRSLSAFIEWAIEEVVEDVTLKCKSGDFNYISNIAQNAWDVDEPERFVKLAIYGVDLLTYDEQKVWKLIKNFKWLFLYNPETDNFLREDCIKLHYVNVYWNYIQIACFSNVESERNEAISRLEEENTLSMNEWLSQK